MQDRLTQLAIEKTHESKLLADAASQVALAPFQLPLYMN